MKISNRFVEVEFRDVSAGMNAEVVTIRFPLTKAEITITGQEAIELWKALDMPYGD